jgi:hypothetical protein
MEFKGLTLFLSFFVVNKIIKHMLFESKVIHQTLRPVRTESFRPGLSLKPGLKLEKGLKSYVYRKT